MSTHVFAPVFHPAAPKSEAVEIALGKAWYRLARGPRAGCVPISAMSPDQRPTFEEIEAAAAKGLTAAEAARNMRVRLSLLISRARAAGVAFRADYDTFPEDHARALAADGLTIREAAARCDWPVERFRSAARRRGIDFRRAGPVELPEDEIRRLAESGMSLSAAADQIGRSRDWLMRRARRYGITFQRGYRRAGG